MLVPSQSSDPNSPQGQLTAQLEIDMVPNQPCCCCWQAGSEASRLGLSRAQVKENCSHLNKHNQLSPAAPVPQQRIHAASHYPSLGNWFDWQARRSHLSLVTIFRGCCVACPPSRSCRGDGAGLVQAPLSIALLQAPPLIQGRFLQVWSRLPE